MKTAIRGSFRQTRDDRYVSLREQLLDGRPLPAPDLEPASVSARRGPGVLEEVLQHQLRDHGLGLVQLDEPLTGARLIDLGDRLGEIMPETDPAVQPNVEQGRILNLVSTEGSTADTSRQPFATTALSLHTEGSGRPAARQPRYIVLMCLNAGDDQNAAQTVLVPFAGVDDRLDDRARDLLGHLRYDAPGVPPVRRGIDGRAAFSFRDFQDDTLNWVCDTDATDMQEVRDTLCALLEAMYDGAGAYGLRWSPGTLAVIDNTFGFHGRSAAPFRGSTRHRHLKRLRITARAAGDA